MTISPPSSSSSSSTQKLHVELKKPHTTQSIKNQVRSLLQEASELSESGERANALFVIAKALKLDKNNKAAEKLFLLTCSAMQQNAKSQKGEK